MKLAAALFVVWLLVPAGALAQHPGHPPPPPCGDRPHQQKGKHSQPQCISGSVLAISATGMRLHAPHGHPVSIRFTAKTVFQTDSGPGTLEGIMPGDFACVTGTVRKHDLTAQLVVFDLMPFPCPVKKPHHPPKDESPAPSSPH
ncbi:MAG: hypothetical protein ACR2JC_04800 [Chloroflexota bacterium]|nr:MAG: hypothetical protein DLM70_16370 [Chloroflexota bacterium]